MKKDKLNTDKFDFEEPVTGHRERFAQRIEKKKAFNKPAVLIGLVASIALIVMYIFPINYSADNNLETFNEPPMCMNQELQEIEFYYASQEMNRINEIKSYPIDSNLMNQEVLQLDSIVQKLCRDLQTDPYDERIIETAITHYQMKIKTLDHILKQLKSINQLKEEENEEINL